MTHRQAKTGVECVFGVLVSLIDAFRVIYFIHFMISIFSTPFFMLREGGKLGEKRVALCHLMEEGQCRLLVFGTSVPALPCQNLN